MGLALRRRRHAGQPLGAFNINWANPISNRLIYCLYPPAGRKDIVRGQNPATITGSPALASTAIGQAVVVSASDYYTITRSTTPAYIATTSAAHTILAVFRPTATINQDATLISFGEVSDGNYTTSLCIDTSGGAKLAHGIDAPNTQAISTFTIAVGQICVAAVSVTGAAARTFMLNGQIATNTTSIAGGACTAGASVGISFQGSAAVASTAFIGEIALILAWNRALSAPELRAMAENPYQVLQTPPRRRVSGKKAGTAYTSSMTAALSFAVSATKRAARTVTGAVSFIGLCNRALALYTARLGRCCSRLAAFQLAQTIGCLHIPSAQSGSLPTTGSVLKRTSRAVTGSLSFVGSIAKQAGKALTGVLSFIGSNPTRAIVHTMTGALSFVGSALKLTTRSLTAASLSLTGACLKQGGKACAGVLAFAGVYGPTAIRHVLAGSLSFIGSTAKFTSRTVAGSLSFIGSLAKQAAKALSGSVSFSGAVTKSTNRALTASAGFVGSCAKQAARACTGALSFTGSAAKSTARALSGVLSFIGNLVTQFTSGGGGAVLYTLAVSASLSFSGSITKRTARLLTASTSLAGSCAKITARLYSGTLSFSGSFARARSVFFTAALSFTGSVTKQAGKALAASLSFAGSIARRTSRAFAATLSFTGSCAVVFVGLLVDTNAEMWRMAFQSVRFTSTAVRTTWRAARRVTRL